MNPEQLLPEAGQVSKVDEDPAMDVRPLEGAVPAQGWVTIQHLLRNDSREKAHLIRRPGPSNWAVDQGVRSEDCVLEADYSVSSLLHSSPLPIACPETGSFLYAQHSHLK